MRLYKELAPCSPPCGGFYKVEPYGCIPLLYNLINELKSFLLRRKIMSFWKWLEDEVETQNEWVKEDEGISYFFHEDSIYDDFINEADISEEDMENDEVDVLRPLFEEWAKTAKPFKYTSKDINARRREDAADLRTQAMEMGYHNYSSDNGGTWYQD